MGSILCLGIGGREKNLDIPSFDCKVKAMFVEISARFGMVATYGEKNLPLRDLYEVP